LELSADDADDAQIEEVFEFVWLHTLGERFAFMDQYLRTSASSAEKKPKGQSTTDVQPLAIA
jgi:hypothetical protein